MFEYLYYLGYACASAEEHGSDDVDDYRRLACKIKTAIEMFGGMILLTSTEWELLQRAKNMCGELK